MMYRVFIVLFAVCMPTTSAARELESSPSLEATADVESTLLRACPAIERIMRAHLTPDGPPIQNDISLNLHHVRRLSALSIRDEAFGDFLIFRGGRLRSLRLYNCQVEDFNSFTFLHGIEELHLRKCQMQDVSPLVELTELRNLSLTDNRIEDISALSRCRQLTWLDLRNNNIDNVCALRPLRKLIHIDLRDNPLGADSVGSDIRAIKGNNPGVRILLGKQAISKADLEQQLSARAKIAEFALCGRFQYTEGLRPFLPYVSDEISEALTCLGNGDDKEYLVDIAALLMKYAVEIERYYRPGPVWSRGEEPLLDAFMDEVGLKVNLEGMPLQYIVNWIRDNRDRLAASLVLDTQIERYDLLLLELKRKGIYGSSR